MNKKIITLLVVIFFLVALYFLKFVISFGKGISSDYKYIVERQKQLQIEMEFTGVIVDAYKNNSNHYIKVRYKTLKNKNDYVFPCDLYKIENDSIIIYRLDSKNVEQFERGCNVKKDAGSLCISIVYP